MTFSILHQLRLADTAARAEIITELYRKNRSFFRRYYPAVDDYLERNECPYSLQITESFLSVVDMRTGTVAHPQPLDAFAEMMADWDHSAWVDLFSLEVAAPPQYPLHSGPVTRVFEKLTHRFPGYLARYRQGVVHLKSTGGGRRMFSPPVIFFGIFHGLHVAECCRNMDIDSLLLVEPQPDRFEVSLYFLDYESLWKKENALFLSIGTLLNTEAFNAFFSVDRITPHLWCRVLPGYVMESTPYFLEQFRMLQRSKIQILYPVDYMIRDQMQGLRNLRRGLPLLADRPEPGQPFSIAIAASGPSLERAIPWLIRYRERLVLFAVHTAVRVLRQHGIRPDFQFCLDTVFHRELVAQMRLYPDVPLILNYQAAEEYFELTQHPLLVASADTCHPVSIGATLLEDVAPSTTNLAFALACHCCPRSIFLLGCDFGFRSPDAHHCRGSLYIDAKGKECRKFQGKRDACLLVPPNMAGTEPVLSTPFFMQAKQAMEKAIARAGKEIIICNLSDGALVEGAAAAAFEDCVPDGIMSRAEATSLIGHLFVSPRKGLQWRPYRTSGTRRLDCLRQRVLERLSMEHFSWPDAAARFNSVIGLTLAACREAPDDRRLNMYAGFLSDLLSHIYICMLFCDMEQDAAEVYRQGISFLHEELDELCWPPELTDR